MGFRLLVFTVVSFWVVSCSSSKKLTDNTVEQELAPFEVVASRENPYRATPTRDFDLIHTRLEVIPDYQKQYLYGKATITLKPHFYNQKELVLDAKQFDINEVSLLEPNGNRLKLDYNYDSLQLKIRLNKEYSRNETLKIFVDYTAKPNERKGGGSIAITSDKGLYFINPTRTDTTKPEQIWTQGETESNSCWFPTIDKPNQKMTNEILITRPKKYVSLSNGLMVSSKALNDSMMVDHWKMDLPHAPYLVMMAIGEFAVTNERWRDIPVSYYLEPEYAPYAKQIFGNTPEMMEFFSQKLQFDYPWQKYSQVVVRDYVSGAMENTTATIHGEFLQKNSRELIDETFEDIISHELFHQWFGDVVTTESWSNIPLNESFATYGEYLWNEYKYGKEFADYKFYENYELYLEEAKGKNVELIRYHYDNREDMFDRHSYEKGGLILHYLRKTIGDEAFFKSLELYLKTNQFKPVELAQLRLAFEEVTGKDLNWFFNQWFFNSGHPVLDITNRYENDTVYIAVEQSQSSGHGLIYQLPVQIGIWQDGKMMTYPIEVRKKSEVFAFAVGSKPDLIDFDAERALLCQKKENKTAGEYIYQYQKGTSFWQRREALAELAEAQKQSDSALQTMALALNDRFYILREFAVRKLYLSGADSNWTIIKNLAVSDRSSKVRRAAIDKLAKNSNLSEYTHVFERAVTDSSYDVASASLKAFYAADSTKALSAAKLLEEEKNISISAAVSDIYSKAGDSTFQNYFEKKIQMASGFGKYTALYYYANFLTRMNKNIVLTGIQTMAREGILSNSNIVTGAAKGSLKRIVKTFEERKKNLKADEATTISEYNEIIASANNALDQISKKKTEEKN